MPNFYPLHKNNIGITVGGVPVGVITATCVLSLVVEGGRACEHFVIFVGLTGATDQFEKCRELYSLRQYSGII